MALAADITALRDRVLADLNAAHDYYTDTTIAWDIVRGAIAAGRTLSIRNLTSLGAKTVEFHKILDAPDKEAITLQVVNHELNEIMYARPADWFSYLEGKVKLGCPTADEIAKIAEAKASRNVLVHNRGVASKTYESKAGNLARYKDGQHIDIPENYHRQTGCSARLWRIWHNAFKPFKEDRAWLLILRRYRPRNFWLRSRRC